MMTGRGVVDDDDDETTSSSEGSSSSSDSEASEAPPSAHNGTKAAVPPIRKDGMGKLTLFAFYFTRVLYTSTVQPLAADFPPA